MGGTSRRRYRIPGPPPATRARWMRKRIRPEARRLSHERPLPWRIRPAFQPRHNLSRFGRMPRAEHSLHTLAPPGLFTWGTYDSTGKRVFSSGYLPTHPAFLPILQKQFCTLSAFLQNTLTSGKYLAFPAIPAKFSLKFDKQVLFPLFLSSLLPMFQRTNRRK